MSGPSPYDALFEIFGQEWDTKKEDHKRHMKIYKKSTKNREYKKRKPSKIDNACQTHPLRDYSYNKIVNPSRRKVSSKIIHKEDVTINYSDDTIKEYKKQSSIGIHLKSSHVNALYKTVSDIEKLFREERNLHLHSRKCLCNSCGTLGVITESMKHPVDFGDDETTESEEESEEEEEEEDEIPDRYNNSKKSWKVEYKDSEAISRGPSQEGYIRLLVELERMIRRVHSLEQIALKHNIPIKRNKIDVAYDVQTNRLKNGVSRKLSSTSSSDVDRRQCKLFTIPDIIKRTFSRKRCTMETQNNKINNNNNNRPPNLRSKNYQFRQNTPTNTPPRNTFTEAEKQYQAKCLDEKIQNFDLSLLNEDEICELMFHLKNKASNKNKNCNQKTMPTKKIQHHAEAMKQKHHNVHKHEHKPFKLGSSPVGLRTVNNNGIRKSLRNDTTVIRKSQNYHNNDTETNKMSRTLYQDYLKANNVTPAEQQNDRNIQQLHRNPLLRDSIPRKDSFTFYNKITKSKSKNNLGYDLNPACNNTKTSNTGKKWINGVISQSIGVLEENYQHQIKISDVSIKSKIGKTVTYSTLNRYHHYVKEVESDPSINSGSIEMAHCSGLCQKNREAIEDNSSDDELSTDSESNDSENNVRAREKDNKELITTLRKPSQHMLKNWDENKVKDSFSNSSEASNAPVVRRPLRSELRAQNQDRVAKISEFISNSVFPDTPNEELHGSFLIKLQSSLSISCNGIGNISKEYIKNQISIDEPQKNRLAIELKKPVTYCSSSQTNEVNQEMVKPITPVKKESIGVQVVDIDVNKENNKLESNEDNIKISKSCEVNLNKVRKLTIPLAKKESKEIQVEKEKESKNILINVNKDKNDIEKCERTKNSTSNDFTGTVKNKPAIDEMDPYLKKLTLKNPIITPEFKLNINPRPKIDKIKSLDLNVEKQYKDLVENNTDIADKYDSYFKRLETKKPYNLSIIEKNNGETSTLSSSEKNDCPTDSTISTDSSRKENEKSNFQEKFEYKLNMINNKFKDIDTNETLKSPKVEKKCCSEKTPYSYRKNNENVNASNRFKLNSNMQHSHFKGFDSKEAFKLPDFERKTCPADNWYFYGGSNKKVNKTDKRESNYKPVVSKVQSIDSNQYDDCVKIQKEVKEKFDKLFPNRIKSNKEPKNEESTESNKFSKNSLIANRSSSTLNTSKNEKHATELSEKCENIIEEIHECPLTYMYNNDPSVSLKHLKIEPSRKCILKTYKRVINNEPLKLNKRNSIVINKFKKQVYISTVQKVSSTIIHEIIENKSANVTLSNVFQRQKHIREETIELPSKIPIPLNRQNRPNGSDNSTNDVSKIPIYKYKNNNTCLQAFKAKNLNQKYKNVFLYYTVHSNTNCAKNTRKREISMPQTNTTNNIKPKKAVSKKPKISKIPIIKQQKENIAKQFTSSTSRSIKKESIFPSPNRANNSVSKNLQLLQALLPKPSLKIITKGRINTELPKPSKRSPKMISKEKTNTDLPITAERSPKMITKEKTNTKLPIPTEPSPKIISKEKSNTKLFIPTEPSPKIPKEENRLLPVPMCFNILKAQVDKQKQNTTVSKTLNKTVQINKKDQNSNNIICTNISPTENTENKTTSETSNKPKVFPIDSDILSSYNSQIEKVNRKNENNAEPVESNIINSYNSQIEKVKNKLTKSTIEDSYPTTHSFYMPNDIEEDKCETEAGLSSCTFSDGGSGAIFIYKSNCKLESDNSFMDSEFESVYTSACGLNNPKPRKKWKWLQKITSKFKSFMSFPSLKVTSMTSDKTADTTNKKNRWSSISKFRNRKDTSSMYTLSVKKKKPKNL